MLTKSPRLLTPSPPRSPSFPEKFPVPRIPVDRLLNSRDTQTQCQTINYTGCVFFFPSFVEFTVSRVHGREKIIDAVYKAATGFSNNEINDRRDDRIFRGMTIKSGLSIRGKQWAISRSLIHDYRKLSPTPFTTLVACSNSLCVTPCARVHATSQPSIY